MQNSTEDKKARARVSNEQILAAIMAQTAAISSLVTVLTTQKTEAVATPAVNNKPVQMAQASFGYRTIGDLETVKSLPEGIKGDWLAGLCYKAEGWAKRNGVTEPVIVYFVKNQYGKVSPMFGRASSKVSANAIGAFKRVN